MTDEDVNAAGPAKQETWGIRYERDIIQENIADDPLWAAQTIVAHGSRELIDRLLQKHFDDMASAYNLEDKRSKQT